MTEARTTTCRYHCSSCGTHFTSLEAFDAHRHHEIGVHPKGWRGVLSTRCLAPEDVGLTAESGECRLGPRVLKGEPLWHDADARDRVLARFGPESLREGISCLTPH